MIRLITATPGSGKTCLVIEWLLREIDKGFYKSFYSNINGLKVTGVRPLLDDWRTVPEENKPALIIVDEAQYFPAFMKETTKDNQIGKDLSTHRHHGVDLWLITQSPKLLNSYVIENTGEHVHLYRPKKAKTVTVYWWSYAITNMSKSNFKVADDVQKWRLNPVMFNYYTSTVAVTDAKGRISQRNVSTILVFLVIMGGIIWAVKNGSGAFHTLEHGDKDKVLNIDNKAMPTDKNLPKLSNTVSSSASEVATSMDLTKLADECRKGENIDKPECKKWYDDMSKQHASMNQNGIVTFSYNPNKPYDQDKVQQQVNTSYQVINKPYFSGCMMKNGRYAAYTEQGTILKDVSQSDCKRLIKDNDRPYDYYHDHQQMQVVQQPQMTDEVQQQSSLGTTGHRTSNMVGDDNVYVQKQGMATAGG